MKWDSHKISALFSNLIVQNKGFFLQLSCGVGDSWKKEKKSQESFGVIYFVYVSSE